MTELSKAARELKNEYARKWKAQNRDKINQYHKQWRERNKDKMKYYDMVYWERKATNQTLPSNTAYDRAVIRQISDEGWQLSDNPVIKAPSDIGKKCIICGNELNSKRIDIKYCSPACRQKHYRQK